MKTTLCVMFNHPYLKNIPLLREALQGSFDSVYFIVPYTASSDEDVITSYRGSYNFHGYIVDATERLLQSDSDYFFFLQDDVVLNPHLTGELLVEKLRLKKGGAFLPDFRPLAGELSAWQWTLNSIWKTLYPMNRMNGSGAEQWLAALPAADETLAKLRTKYGFEFAPITFDRGNTGMEHSLGPDQFHSTFIYRTIAEGLFSEGSAQLPYSLCIGMSDFFAVDRATLLKLRHPLGVFAAVGLFVEMALPTALAIAAERVVRCTDIGMVASWLWGNRESLDAETIKRQFAENLLLLHPVKISQDEALYRKLHDLPNTKPGEVVA